VSNDAEEIPASHEPGAARPNRRRVPRTVYASGQGFVKQNPQRRTEGSVGEGVDGQEGYGVGTGLMSEVVPGTEFALEVAVGLVPVHRRRKAPPGGPDVPGIVFDRYHATR